MTVKELEQKLRHLCLEGKGQLPVHGFNSYFGSPEHETIKIVTIEHDKVGKPYVLIV